MINAIAPRDLKTKSVSGFLYLFLLCAAIITITAGCAGRAYLMVDYTVPPASRQLQNLSVRVDIKDIRQEKRVLSPSAKYHFQGFQGRYSLAWVTPDNGRILAGEHDLQNLFRAAFSKRLQQLGVGVTEKNQTPIFTVVLKEFKIDLQDRKWLAKVSYETNLTRDGSLIARETATGNAERIRIIGRKGADVVLSEIFTDIVNRVNIVHLFQKAKMIP